MPLELGGGSRRSRQQQPPTGTTTTTTPGTIGQAIDEINAGAGGGGGGTRQPIGVAPGYSAATPRQNTPGYYPHGYSYSRRGYGAGASPTQMVNVPARYYTDDEYAPANFTDDVIRELQRQLAYVGLFDQNASIIPGDWGEETASAFRRLLAYSNQHGMTYRTALTQLRSKVEAAGGPAAGGKMMIDEFGNLVPASDALAEQRPPLLTRTTDPRTVGIVAREVSMNLLGQALSPDQVNAFTQAYNQMEVARQQEAYDKQLTGGSVVDIPSTEAFMQGEIESKYPAEAAQYKGVQYLNDAMQLLASPAWGV